MKIFHYIHKERRIWQY